MDLGQYSVVTGQEDQTVGEKSHFSILNLSGEFPAVSRTSLLPHRDWVTTGAGWVPGYLTDVHEAQRPGSASAFFYAAGKSRTDFSREPRN